MAKKKDNKKSTEKTEKKDKPEQANIPSEQEIMSKLPPEAQKKLKEMRIISMNSIYKKIDDPFEPFPRELAESDGMAYPDSAAISSPVEYDNDFQNIDQMIYLHHFGKYLPKKGESSDLLKEDLKEEPAPIITEDNTDEATDVKKKKKVWPFGKKKAKSGDESLNEEEK